ncbi:MAG: LysM peptidoglycan-binding domain-containing protein [Acidobacteriota bacterium]
MPIRLARLVFPLLLAVLATATATFGQDAGVDDSLGEEALRDGFYVVRPGDTLQQLSLRYLGDAERWREIWRLNPDVEDPDVLQPGQELKVFWRRLPDDGGAVIAQTSNRVEDRQPPKEWANARERDLLRPRDSVRTYTASSAELVFGDRTRLTLSEESAVTLDPGRRQAERLDRDQVELVAGQADLQGDGLAAGDSGIELLIGDAAAKPKPTSDGRVETRARKSEDGAAQLMVYQGASDLTAGGEVVAVGEGMGSQVPEGGGPPSPPEELLDAVDLLDPAADLGLMTPRPGFHWSPIDGAASYTIEVCADDACAQLVRRQTGLGETAWQPTAKLPKASYFWRVTATSASGLDGYPSAVRAFDVLSDDEDTTPPTVAFRVLDPRRAPRWGMNRHWILGPGARLEAIADDAQSGLDSWVPEIDGKEVSAEVWQAGPWDAGVQMAASFVAVDRAANRARLPDIPFVYDDESPVVTWGLEGSGPRGPVEAPAEPVDAFPRQPGQQVRSVRDPHTFWPWRKQSWWIERDPRQIVLRPNRPVIAEVEGQRVVLTPERGVWILVEDRVCRDLDRLDFDLRIDVDGKWPGRRSTAIVLRLAAEDLVTNAVQGELTLRTIGRARDADLVQEP